MRRVPQLVFFEHFDVQKFRKRFDRSIAIEHLERLELPFSFVRGSVSTQQSGSPRLNS
jgi:hypothetical protein